VTAANNRRLFRELEHHLAAFTSAVGLSAPANTSRFFTQVQNFINDNPNLKSCVGAACDRHRLLVARQGRPGSGGTILGKTSPPSTNCRVGTTSVSLPLVADPYWVFQPWVESGFQEARPRSRGVLRSAGLPAFRFPAPRTRFPQRCAPPAHRVGGHPRIIHAPRWLRVRPVLRTDVGPSATPGTRGRGGASTKGIVPSVLWAVPGLLPRLASSTPNPKKKNKRPCRRTPGIPIAGAAGIAPQTSRGHTLRPPGRPGARTDPLGPAVRFRPVDVSAVGVPPGPPAPPGPGNQLPLRSSPSFQGVNPARRRGGSLGGGPRMTPSLNIRNLAAAKLSRSSVYVATSARDVSCGASRVDPCRGCSWEVHSTRLTITPCCTSRLRRTRGVL